MPLSAGELAALRVSALAFLPDVALIERPTALSDGRGGTGLSFAPVASGVPCRLAPSGRSDSEYVTATQLGERSAWVLTFAHDVGLQLADRVTVDGEAYEITFVDDNRSESISIRAGAKEFGT